MQRELQRRAVDAVVVVVPVLEAGGARAAVLAARRHRQAVGRAAGRAGDALALEAVLGGDAVTLARALVVVLLDGAHIVLDIRADGALRLHHLVHQDLFHLPVVQVVQLPDRVLGPGDEVEQDGPGGDPRHELVLAQPLRGRPLQRVLLETRVHEVSEDVAPGGVRECGGLVLGDVVQSTHGVHVEVGRLPLGQLDAGDAHGPDVHLAVILALVHGEDHLGRHPVRRPHEAVGRTRDGRGPEVRQLDVAGVGEENVASLDIPATSHQHQLRDQGAMHLDTVVTTPTPG